MTQVGASRVLRLQLKGKFSSAPRCMQQYGTRCSLQQWKRSSTRGGWQPQRSRAMLAGALTKVNTACQRHGKTYRKGATLLAAALTERRICKVPKCTPPPSLHALLPPTQSLSQSISLGCESGNSALSFAEAAASLSLSHQLQLSSTTDTKKP